MRRYFLSSLLTVSLFAAWPPQANPPLTIRTADRTVTVTNARGLIFPNGSLSENNGEISVTFNGESGANTALSNLSSVAINTSLISDTNNTDDLGSSGIKWKNLYLAGNILGTGTNNRIGTETSAFAIADTMFSASSTTQAALALQSAPNTSVELFVILNSSAARGVSVGMATGSATMPGATADFRTGISGTGAIGEGFSLVEKTTGSNRVLSWGINNSGAWQMAYGGQAYGFDSGSLFYVKSDAQIGFISGTNLSTPGSPDTLFSRSAAGVVSVDAGAAGTLGKLKYGRLVVAKTSDYTVLAADKNVFFTNTGAVGAVSFTLPTAATGLTFEFYVDADQTVTIVAPASTTIRIGSSVTSAAGNISANSVGLKVGSRVRLVAINTTQYVGDLTGTWAFN